jgi:hypothetical protein
MQLIYMPLRLVSLMFMPSVVYVTYTYVYVTNMSYVICHYATKAYVIKVCVTWGLVYYVNGMYATKAYVIKVCVTWGLVYYVNGMYATKAHIIQPISIKFVVSLRLVSFGFDVNIIKAYICSEGLCEVGLFH